MVLSCHALVDTLFGKLKFGGVDVKSKPSIRDEEFGDAKLASNFLGNENSGVVSSVLDNCLRLFPPGDIINYVNDLLFTVSNVFRG